MISRLWAVDFQFDATTDGRPIKIVSILDEHRECLGGPVASNIVLQSAVAAAYCGRPVGR
jgi:putative transposase